MRVEIIESRIKIADEWANGKGYQQSDEIGDENGACLEGRIYSPGPLALADGIRDILSRRGAFLRRRPGAGSPRSRRLKSGFRANKFAPPVG